MCERERAHACAWRGGSAEGETQADTPLGTESNKGLDPMIPEPKPSRTLNQLSHQGPLLSICK